MRLTSGRSRPRSALQIGGHTGNFTMANTFGWIEIRTRDIETTASFYEALFGWKVIEKETADGFDVWIFDTGGEPRVQNLRRGGIGLRPG